MVWSRLSFEYSSRRSRSVLALPVVDAVGGDAASRVLVSPDLLPRRGIERDDRIVLREDVHDVVDDERVEEIVGRIAGWVRPGDFQRGDVRAVDLRERRVLRLIRSAAVVAPRRVWSCANGPRGLEHQETAAEQDRAAMMLRDRSFMLSIHWTLRFPLAEPRADAARRCCLRPAASSTRRRRCVSFSARVPIDGSPSRKALTTSAGLQAVCRRRPTRCGHAARGWPLPGRRSRLSRPPR